MCLVERINKKLNVLMLGALMIAMISGATYVGFTLTSHASEGQVVETEEVLLKKDSIVKEITVFGEELNPYFATSKMTVIANMSQSKLETLARKGYKINITDKETNTGLAEPVVVNYKEIEISLYSNDSEIIDVINNLK